METAKVDIRKLQLLNDRINQCIDALNQVRISVHGLSHSTGIPTGAPNAYPQLGGFAQGISPAQTGFFAPGMSPFGVNPGVGQFGGFAGLSGLSHTSPESIEGYGRSPWSDPYLAAKITQTFPYLQFALPPVVSLV